MRITGEDELIEFCKRNRKLVIYGAGKFGAIVERFCRERRISIYCFCVTQIDEKDIFLGYPVKEIDEIQKNFSDAGIIIAVSEKFAGQVLEKVKGLHYFYNRCLLKEMGAYDVMKSVREQIKSVHIKENTLCCAGGIALHKNIFYIVCPGSIGDTLYVASLVKAFKSENKIPSVFLIVKENQESIPGLFSAIDGSIVSNRLVEIMDAYSRSKVIWRLSNYLYGFAREDYFGHSYMKPYAAKNLLSGYKTAIMDLQEDAEYEEMLIEQETPVSDEYNKKTIIVMSHESSAKRLPLLMWEEICKDLNKSYNVYTNTKDKTELPIKGTKVISQSLKNMATICEKCFAVISIRTGMCDLLAFTKTNLIVLNTEPELAEKWDLTKVFHRQNLVNIDCYGEFSFDVLKKDIMAHLKKFSDE